MSSPSPKRCLTKQLTMT